MRRFSLATVTGWRPARSLSTAVACLLAAAVAPLAACGSSGSARPPGGAHGQDAAPTDIFGRLDAGATDAAIDAAPIFSCPAFPDGGTTCIQFDPDYPDPAGVCAAQHGGPVASAPCSTVGSAGGCHVVAGSSGYTIWMYGRQPGGALLVHCQQLGDSYVSPDFDVTVDASAHATGPGPGTTRL